MCPLNFLNISLKQHQANEIKYQATCKQYGTDVNKKRMITNAQKNHSDIL